MKTQIVKNIDSNKTEDASYGTPNSVVQYQS